MSCLLAEVDACNALGSLHHSQQQKRQPSSTRSLRDPPKTVLLLCTCASISAVDPALLRAGRIDTHIGELLL